MARVADVAAYILEQAGPMTAMKLQKLVYYSQAWSLVWDEAALFDARVEAWANGPVVPQLYDMHRGRFMLNPGEITGTPGDLLQRERETVDGVLAVFGGKTAQELSDLTHQEAPWRDARIGLGAGERGGNEITIAAMHEFYSGL
jgi:uncharacterized phage-associated protein